MQACKQVNFMKAVPYSITGMRIQHDDQFYTSRCTAWTNKKVLACLLFNSGKTREKRFSWTCIGYRRWNIVVRIVKSISKKLEHWNKHAFPETITEGHVFDWTPGMQRVGLHISSTIYNRWAQRHRHTGVYRHQVIMNYKYNSWTTRIT